MNTKIGIFIFLLSFLNQANSEGFDKDNDPEKFGIEIKKNLNDLPTSGKLDRSPWSDDYWRSSRGGISYRWRKKNDFECDFLPKEEDAVERYAYEIGKIPSNDKLSCLSPSEKFDLYLDDKNWSLTKYERERTQIMKKVNPPKEDPTFQIPEWEGLCHGWAPASLYYPEPKPILLKNPNGLTIPFGSADIKALLSLGIDLSRYFSKPETKFVGERCKFSEKEFPEKLSEKNFLLERIKKGEINPESLELERKKLWDRYDKEEIGYKEYAEKMDKLDPYSTLPCLEDINAGTFHLLVTNQIGRKKEGFVMDASRFSMVWNQPIFGYSYKIFPYNNPLPKDVDPKTVEVKLVVMQIDYTVETAAPKWSPPAGFYPRRDRETGEIIRVEDLSTQNSPVYKYLLELDHSGNIIGGLWLPENKDRPDFVWKTIKPDAFVSILQAIKPAYEKSLLTQTYLSRLKKEIVANVLPAIWLKEQVKKRDQLVPGRTKELFDELDQSYKGRRVPDIKKIKYLLRLGAKLELEKGDEMAMRYAVALENLQLIKVFQNAGISGSLSLLSALMNSAKPTQETYKMIILLINGGADVNLKYKKLTPLILAKDLNGPFAALIVKTLLLHGALKEI